MRALAGAGGQAAQEKGNPLLVTQSLAYRAVVATATGDHLAARELTAEIAAWLEGDQLSYNAGVLAFAVAGLRAAEGDHQAAYDLLLRCWRFDAARECRFYHRCLVPDLVRLALALGHLDVAAEVTGGGGGGTAQERERDGPGDARPPDVGAERPCGVVAEGDRPRGA